MARAGRSYGLELNLQKIVLLRIRGDAKILGPDGNPRKAKDETVYLGSSLTTSGHAAPELSRRLGEVGASFKALAALWKHANVPKKKKYSICEACIVSKLMHGMETLWLHKAHLQKLDAFGARYLRKIAGILPSFVSWVPEQNCSRRV